MSLPMDYYFNRTYTRLCPHIQCELNNLGGFPENVANSNFQTMFFSVIYILLWTRI